jgi:hypothetical protein
MSPTRLIFNSGQSAIKLSLYSAPLGSAPVLLVKSSVSGLTSPPAKFSYSNNANNGHDVEDSRELGEVMDQGSALGFFLTHLGQDNSLGEHGAGEDELMVYRILHEGLLGVVRPRPFAGGGRHHDVSDELAPKTVWWHQQ